MPTWKETSTGQVHYELPEQLTCLREGEKLLIQKASTYVPILFLKHGQVGLNGHVCAYPKDVQEVCNVLPRKPSQIQLVKVQKTIQNGDEVTVKTFTIRRKVVLEALLWLKDHNGEYKDIMIKKANLDWMDSDKQEQELPFDNDNCHEIEMENQETHKSQTDTGPSEKQAFQVNQEQKTFTVCME